MNRLRRATESGQPDSSPRWNAFVQPLRSLNGSRKASDRIPSPQSTSRRISVTSTPLFSKDSFNELPGTKLWDHAVKLAPDASPKSGKVYPLSASKQKELDAFLKENLDSGRIRPSKSPMAALVFFVKKKDGGLCLVQDYHALNAMTMKNKYPLPLIPELIAKLCGAKYFTKLDVRWGFNNVWIKEGDEWKAAF